MVILIKGLNHHFFLHMARWTIEIFASLRVAGRYGLRYQNAGTLQLLAGGLIAVTLVAPASATEVWTVVPKLMLTESYSDNVTLNQASSSQGGWVTEAVPGLFIEHKGARAYLYVNYELHHFFYDKQSQSDRTQNLLSSNARIEAIDNWLFVDALANISQQNRSAFGPSTASDSLGASSNRVETSTYQVAPNIRGRLSNYANYQARVSGTQSHTGDGALPDTKTTDWTGQIKSVPSTARIGWSIDGNSLIFRNDVVGKREDSRIRGSIIFEIDPQLRFSVSGGREITNYSTPAKTATATSGVGIEWSPTSRTRIAAVQERRFFGNGHIYFFSHRTPLTAWRISSSRDVTVLPTQMASAQRGSTYDLLNDLLTSAIPDPISRGSAIDRRLQVSGIPANAALGRGFLTGRPFLNLNHEASIALLGATNTATFTFSQTEQRGLALFTRGADSFSLSNNIRQRAFNLNWARKLSALSTLTLIATSLRTEALDAINLESKQYSLNVFMSTQLSPKATASLGVRHIKFESSADAGYEENVLFASIAVRF